jgi:hypothetical protein
MNKSEKKVINRVREANDAGSPCFTPVGNTKGRSAGWRRGRVGQKPIKAEETAFAKLLEGGELIYAIGHGGHVVAGHPLLATIAAALDLGRYRFQVDSAASILKAREDDLERAADFKRKYGT